MSGQEADKTQVVEQDFIMPNIVKAKIITFPDARGVLVSGALDNLRKCVPEPENLPQTVLSPNFTEAVDPGVDDILGQHILDIYKRIKQLEAEQAKDALNPEPKVYVRNGLPISA